MNPLVYRLKDAFKLESGATLPELEIAYHTYGKLNGKKSNVIWVCHALTANSNALDWWSALHFEGSILDPEKHFIVCANILGSCYGTTGPMSRNPLNDKPYYSSFPAITIRDMVKAHQALAEHLEIDKIAFLLGGSMGGFQALEWAIARPDQIQRLVLLCTGMRESAWGIAIHTAQRMAIESDPTWKEHDRDAGRKGLMAARAIGMLTYRNYEQFILQQTDEDLQKLDDFKASRYIQYQGEKLANRFHAFAYWVLTKAMDSHNVGRGHGRMEDALNKIKADCLVIGISTDQLCPPEEQQILSAHLQKSQYVVIDSEMGHDGFLTEGKKINAVIQNWLIDRVN